MFTEYLLINDVWISLLAVINSIFLIWSLEKEKYIVAFIVFLSFSGIFICFYNISQVKENLELIWILYYFLIGIIYSGISWICFVIKIKLKNNLAKKKWLSGHKELSAVIEQRVFDTKKSILKGEKLEEQLQKEELFLNTLNACNGIMTRELNPFWENYEINLKLTRPEPNNFKLKISSWFLFWPFLLVLNTLKYPVWYVLGLFPILLRGVSKIIWR